MPVKKYLSSEQIDQLREEIFSGNYSKEELLQKYPVTFRMLRHYFIRNKPEDRYSRLKQYINFYHRKQFDFFLVLFHSSLSLRQQALRFGIARGAYREWVRRLQASYPTHPLNYGILQTKSVIVHPLYARVFSDKYYKHLPSKIYWDFLRLSLCEKFGLPYELFMREAQKSYRQLCRTYHPDLCPGKEVLFQKTCVAYQRICRVLTEKTYNGLQQKIIQRHKYTLQSYQTFSYKSAVYATKSSTYYDGFQIITH